MAEVERRCNCASYGHARRCPIHTQADFDAQDADNPFDVLNLALQALAPLGDAYGYGDMAVDLIAALRRGGFVIVRRCGGDGCPGCADCTQSPNRPITTDREATK